MFGLFTHKPDPSQHTHQLTQENQQLHDEVQTLTV